MPPTKSVSEAILYGVSSHLPSRSSRLLLVTCAVAPRFSSVTSGSGYDKVEYIGASLGATNPVREVITEAHTLFGGDSGVASLLSLGTGHPGVISFPSGDGVDLSKVMRDMMNDCEQRARRLSADRRVGIYFRFSVEQGMQSNHLGPVADLNQVMAQTKNYLAEQRIGERLTTSYATSTLQRGSLPWINSVCLRRSIILVSFL